MMLRIRRAVPGDVPQILAFVRELADYEKVPQEDSKQFQHSLHLEDKACQLLAQF